MTQQQQWQQTQQCKSDDAAEPVAADAAKQVDDAAEPVAAVATVAAMQADDAAEPVAAVSVFQVDPDNNGMGSLSKQESVAEANERLKRQKQARKLKEAAAFEQHLEAERHMIEEYEREAEREAEKERQSLRLYAAWKKQTKEQPWMQAGNGPSGTRIEDVTAETAEATRLDLKYDMGGTVCTWLARKKCSDISGYDYPQVSHGWRRQWVRWHSISHPVADGEGDKEPDTCSTQTTNHRSHR